MDGIKIIKEAYTKFINCYNEIIHLTEVNSVIKDEKLLIDIKLLNFNTKKRDKVIALLYYITYFINTESEKYNEEGLLINRNWLKEYFKFKNNKEASTVLNLLIYLDILIISKNFNVAKHKSRCFKFNEDFNLNEFEFIQFNSLTNNNLGCYNNVNLSENIPINISLLLKNKNISYNPYGIHQSFMMDKLSMDNSVKDKIKELLNISELNQTYKRNNPSLNYPLFNSTLRILNKNVTVKKGQEQRLYSTFTSLSRKIRPYFLFDNKNMIEVDVASCQLTMMAAIFRQLLPTHLISSDFIEFESYCNSGKIYQIIAEQAELEGLLNSEKGYFKGLFMQVWYGTNKKYTIKDTDYENILVERIRYAMKSLFPTMYACLQLAKGNASKKTKQEAREYISLLPTALQNFESQIMFNYVSYNLIKENINFLNLHDAIIVNNNIDAKRAVELIKEGFKVYLNSKVNVNSKVITKPIHCINKMFEKDNVSSISTYDLPQNMKNYKISIPEDFYINNDFGNAIHQFCNEYGNIKNTNKNWSNLRRDNNAELWNYLQVNGIYTRTVKEREKDNKDIEKAKSISEAIKKIREKNSFGN